MRKILSISLAAAAILLGACQNQQSGASDGEQNAKGISEHKGELTGAIAYVNIDTLVAHYDLAIDLGNQYAEKAGKIDSELASRGQRLESAIASYQEKVQKVLITRADAVKEEEKLNNQQNELLNYRNQVLNDLAEEETVMNNRIYFGITDYITEFNSNGKYDLILTTSSTGPVIAAKSMLNITSEILEGINKKYAAEKAAGSSTSAE